MISGAHVIVYSDDADADRTFFRDVFGFEHVDVGDGWLIFKLPRAECAVHPVHGGGKACHEMYFIVKDIEAFAAEMKAKNVPCKDPEDHGWGVLAVITLPGGSEFGVYEPRHEHFC